MTTQTIIDKLENILNKVAEGKNLKNFIILPDTNQTQGEGFLSEFFTGKIINQENGESIEVAIKIAPVEKALLDSTLFYKNEVNFYSKVFPELYKFQKEHGFKDLFDNIPTYLAGSLEPKKEFVAMKNLKIGHYKLIEKTKYFDEEHLELIFKIYGKFHALSFAYKQQNYEQFKNLMQHFGDALGQIVNSPGMQNQMMEGYKAALKTFDPVTESEMLSKLNKMNDVKKIVSDSLNYNGDISCLVHGDCWSNNFLFKYKDSGAIESFRIIDFQLAHENSPIHDLAYFFYAGACKKDMDKLDHYLSIYYSSFLNFFKQLHGDLNKMFSLEDLKKEWRKNSHLGLLLGMKLWVSKLTSKEEIEDLLSKGNLPQEKRSEAWLTVMRKTREGEAFKERARNICVHAIEYGIL